MALTAPRHCPPRPSVGGACDRCVAAGVHTIHAATTVPPWAPAIRFCRACAKAVDALLDATGTRPQPDGAGGWVTPSSPAHTGAPLYLWRPDARGLARQIGARGGQVPVSGPASPADGSRVPADRPGPVRGLAL